MRQKVATALLLQIILIINAYGFRFIFSADPQNGLPVWPKSTEAYSLENPDLVIIGGDLWQAPATSETFKTAITDHENLTELLNSNNFLVCTGNHDTLEAIQSFTPSIIKNNSSNYSFVKDNCFFVALAHSYNFPDHIPFLEEELKKPEAQAAKWRIVYVHRPIYCAGRHPGDGITGEDGDDLVAFREVLEKYDVSLLLSGHSHTFERTYLLKEHSIVTEEKSINVTQNPGTIYLISGAAGSWPYLEDGMTGSDWWTASHETANTYSLFTTHGDTLTCQTKNLYGSIVDQFSLFRNNNTPLQNADVKRSKKDLNITVSDIGIEVNLQASHRGKTTFSLYSLNGKMVRQWSKICNGQCEVLPLNNRTLATGSYIMNVTSKEAQQSTLFTVSK